MGCVLYADGACSGNPGPGGWAYALDSGGARSEEWGFDPTTTNNRMELMAVIAGLLRAAALQGGPGRVDVTTDSQYVQKGMSEWIAGWKRNGWRTSSKEPVKNRDLWERLDAIAATMDIGWHWIKGHAGHPGNERCDELARRAIAERRGGVS